MLLLTEQLFDTISQFDPLTAAPKFYVPPSFFECKVMNMAPFFTIRILNPLHNDWNYSAFMYTRI